jgi:uncharacterized repeat protein (TIGR03803 family)
LVEGYDGNFYGTTTEAGKHGRGTVFKMAPQGELTVLYDFDKEGPAIGGLAKAADGNLYGITTGINRTPNRGTIFRVAPNGQVTVVYVFRDRSGGSGRSGWFSFDDPAVPVSALYVGSDSKLYGLTQGGGSNGQGTFFEFDPSDSFVPSEEDKIKAEGIAAMTSLPGRRRSGVEIVSEIVGDILERAAEADADRDANFSGQSNAGTYDGSSSRKICWKCGGRGSVQRRTLSVRGQSYVNTPNMCTGCAGSGYTNY